MFEQSKNFSKLVGLSALLIAFSAAFFSVFGLSKLFAGAELSVIIMASSLEFGKLVAASFLYRYWDRINLLQKFYMTLATIILIIITSAGIFGFLSNAYQGATVEFEKQSTTLMFKEERLAQLQEDKVFLKDELEQAISELPENYRTAKKKLREEYQPQISEINQKLLNIKGEIGDLKTALVETGVDVGPAIFLARIFDTDVDTVVKYFIFMLIVVFDPLAVVLVISYNLTLQVRIKDEGESENIVRNGKTEKKKKPQRLGMYKEGKSLVEKVIKETFKPDEKKEKKSDKVVVEEEPGGGVYEPEEKPKIKPTPFGRGAVIHKK